MKWLHIKQYQEHLYQLSVTQNLIKIKELGLTEYSHEKSCLHSVLLLEFSGSLSLANLN